MQIAHSLRQLSSQILEIHEGTVIHMSYIPPNFELLLGKLGTYHGTATPQALSDIAHRLSQIALSTRFIRGILGYWPA